MVSSLAHLGVSLVPATINSLCKNAFSSANPEILEYSEGACADSEEDEESIEEIESLAIKKLCGEFLEKIYDDC